MKVTSLFGTEGAGVREPRASEAKPWSVFRIGVHWLINQSTPIVDDIFVSPWHYSSPLDTFSLEGKEEVSDIVGFSMEDKSVSSVVLHVSKTVNFFEAVKCAGVDVVSYDIHIDLFFYYFSIPREKNKPRACLTYQLCFVKIYKIDVLRISLIYPIA